MRLLCFFLLILNSSSLFSQDLSYLMTNREIYGAMTAGTEFEFAIHFSPPTYHKRLIQDVKLDSASNRIRIAYLDSFLTYDQIMEPHKLRVKTDTMWIDKLDERAYLFNDSLAFLPDSVYHAVTISVDTGFNKCGLKYNTYLTTTESGWTDYHCIKGIGCFRTWYEVGISHPNATTRVDYYKINGKECGTSRNFSSYELSDMNHIESRKTSIYPNPGAGIVNINTTINWETYALYNINGQLVSNGNFSNQITLDEVTGSNTYILVLTKGDQQYSEKINIIK